MATIKSTDETFDTLLKENKISKAPQEDETTLRWKKLANIN